MPPHRRYPLEDEPLSPSLYSATYLVSAAVARGVLIMIVGLPPPPVVVRVRWAIRLYDHGLSNDGSYHRIAHAAKDEKGKRCDSDDQTANQKSNERIYAGTCCCLSHGMHLVAIKPL
jgi:hypothetical protein